MIFKKIDYDAEKIKLRFIRYTLWWRKLLMMAKRSYNVIKIEWQCREQEKDDVKNINMTFCRKINKIKKR